MGETGDTTETPPADEQENEDEGETENPSGDNETPVTDPAEEPVEDPDEVPVEEEVSDDEALEAEDPEANDGENKTLSIVPNAIVTVEQTVEAVEPDPTEEDKNNTKALESAVITYTNGCVDGGKLRPGVAVTFKLEAKDGKRITKVEYKTKTGDTEGSATEIKATKGTYEVPKSALVHEVTEGDKKVEKNDTSVKIIVTTADVAYTLKAAADSSEDYKLFYPKETDADAEKEITASSTDKILYSAKGEDISFVVKAGESAASKIRKVSVKAGDGEAKTLTSTEADASKNPIYTFKPSDLSGLAVTDDQDITIKVEATAAAAITIDKTGVGEGAELTAVGNDTITALYTADTYVNAGGDSGATSAKEGQLVIFGVKAKTNYTAVEDTDVTATFTATGKKEATSCTVTTVAADASKKVEKHYKIDLSDITESGTLAISVVNELDTEQDAVKTVDFTSISENTVEIKNGAKTVTGQTVKTTADLTFSATAKPGYEIYKVEAVYDKNYASGDGATIEGYVEDLYVGPSSFTPGVAQEGNLASLKAVFTGTDADSIPEDEGHAGKTWTTKSAKIKVYSVLEKIDADKTVSFTTDGYDYEVVTGDFVEDNSDDTYTVKKGADFFEFAVDAVTEPVITVGEEDIAKIAGAATKVENGGWAYKIPAGALEDSAAIAIAHKTFGITVNYPTADVTAEVLPAGSDVPLADGTTADNSVTFAGKPADSTYRFVIEPKDNVKISKVSYTVGGVAGDELEVPKNGVYVFRVDLTGDIKVNVETADAYDLVVMEGDAVVAPDKNKVYNVNYAKTVTAKLVKGLAPQALFNADVKDGAKTAATWASVEDDVVTLHFDSSEYNKVLTVELTLADKTKQSFKVKTNAAAAEVALEGVKSGKVSIPVDTKAEYKLAVKTANASVDGLTVNVIPVSETADAAAIKAAKDAVDAKIIKEDGVTKLAVTAAPGKEGKADVAKVIIVDGTGLTEEQIAALTEKDALKGGVVTVSTTNATIVGKNPEVKLVSTTDKEIKLQITAPKGIIDPVAGEIFYKVDVTAPETFPEGTPDTVKTAITTAVTEWNKTPYKKKADIEAAGGLLAIPVITDPNLKGVKLSGFGVTVTFVQTIAKDAAASDAEKTIVGGKAELPAIETKDPYYEVKLALKKGNSTLITGQNADITVATPNFGKLTSYSTVKVEFVNTSTGKVIGTNARGNHTYKGMVAKYDTLKNAVTVNAGNATCINGTVYNDVYKNLGVKVTAYAENTAYGAVATQKLTVVNGIETINPAAPLEVYKADGKAANFTVTTDLNSAVANGDKKLAPKSKKLKYVIVGGNEGADALPAAIKANVTVKNGKVSINKNYTVAPKAAQNTFCVKVIADDYTRDAADAEYTEDIVITGEGLKMSDIAVFNVTDGDTSAKDIKANEAEIAATMSADEYKVAVLAPGTKLSKKTYDLDSEEVIDPELLTFKSSNKNVIIDEEGNLTIKGAVKNVKITAIPKDGSNPKPVKTLKLTTKQADAAPVLKISRFEGSDWTGNTPLYTGGKKDLTYKGNNTNNYFELQVMKDDGDGNYVPFYLANHQLTVKGGKQITKDVSGESDVYRIVANAETTTITLKDKAKNTSVEYNLKNANFIKDSKIKAPKIATKTKFSQGISFGPNGNNLAYYTVKGGKDDNFTDKYVMLTVDQTKKNPSNIARVFTDEDRVSYLDTPLPILLGDGFNLYVDTSYEGNYNLVATVGSLVDGEFVPAFKDTKVTVKIAKAKAPNLSSNGNYTLSLKNQNGVYINYKSGNGWAEYTGTDWSDQSDQSDTPEWFTKNFAKNAIINGQENNFTKYFEARYDSYGRMYITLKRDLKLVTDPAKPDTAALDQITGNDAAAKNNRIGYISINNGVKYIDVKLNITLKDYTADKTKYKVTASPVLTGPTSVSALTILDGKNKAIVQELIAYSEGALFKPEYDANGNWYLKAKAATEKKAYPVDLYMLPANAPQAYKDAVAAADALPDSKAEEQRAEYEKYCIKASIKISPADKDTAKNKIALVYKNSDTWKVADTDYVVNTGWEKYTPISFKSNLALAENVVLANPASSADYVTFEMGSPKYLSFEKQGEDSYIVLPASYDMTIKIDKAKLAAAIAKDAADNTIKDNKKLKWGSKVNVKATFDYGTNGPVKDELTFKITLPGESLATDKVTEALNDAFTAKLQSDIETLTKSLKDEYTDSLDSQNVIQYINYRVENYIRDEINKAIKGAAVTVTITNGAAVGGGASGAAEEGDTSVTPPASYQIATWWQITVGVVGATEGTEPLYNHKFTIATPSALSDVETAITSLNLGTGTTVGDDEDALTIKVSTTAAEFAAAVRKALGVTATKNISITAEIAEEPKAPTVKETGSIKFNLTIKDLSKTPGAGAAYKKEIEDISYTLPALDNLEKCGQNITNGFTADVLTKIVQDAWKEKYTDKAAFEKEVKDQVLATAQTFITNNPNVTVDAYAKKSESTDDDYTFTAPTSAAAQGTIAFKLHLKDSTTPETEDNKTDFIVTVSSVTLNQISEFQTAAELATAIQTAVTEIDYVETEDAALAAIKTAAEKEIKNPAYNKADLKVKKTEGESNQTVFTKPVENDGTITFVIVETGTGDSDKVTIDSVKIKKQTTTPAPTPSN